MSHSASIEAIWLADAHLELVGRVAIDRVARVDLLHPHGHQLGDARVLLVAERLAAELRPGARGELGRDRLR